MRLLYIAKNRTFSAIANNVNNKQNCCWSINNLGLKQKQHQQQQRQTRTQKERQNCNMTTLKHPSTMTPSFSSLTKLLRPSQSLLSFCHHQQLFKPKYDVFQKYYYHTTSNYKNNDDHVTTPFNVKEEINDESRQVYLQQHSNSQEFPNDNFIASIILNRTDKANAFGHEMIQQLQQVIQQLQFKLLQDHEQQHDNDIRCILIQSAASPKAFSAGADLKERLAMKSNQNQIDAFVTNLRMTFQDLSELPIPIIAVVDGIAVGGGMELALACDIIVSSSTSTFGLKETSLGIIPGAGGTQRLSKQFNVSLGHVKELIWTANLISAQRAQELGFVQNVIQLDNDNDGTKAGNYTVQEKAMELARQIVVNGPIAIRASKQAINDGHFRGCTMREALEIERINYAKTIPTNDRLEGLEAFIAKRKPNYKGN